MNHPSTENNTSSFLPTLEELCGDDDKFYTVSDDVFNYYANGRGSGSGVGVTDLHSSSSSSSSSYGFHLNLSALQDGGNNSSSLHALSPSRRDHASVLNEHKIYSSLSPRREESRFLSTSNTNSVAGATATDQSYYGNGGPRSRRESEGGGERNGSGAGGGFFSSPQHTPREISPRGQQDNNTSAENYYSVNTSHDPIQRVESLSRGLEGGGYSPREIEILRDPSGYVQRQQENNSYYGRSGRDDGGGYYSPRDQPPSHLNKASPRDGYYADPPPSFYPPASSSSARDQSYRRDSSDSIFYPSPRESLSPRAPGGGGDGGGGYYGASRELTPREQLIRQAAESYASGGAGGGGGVDKSLPNPYAPPFIPQQRPVPPSPSASSYGGVPTLQFTPPYMNPSHRQQLSSSQSGGGGGVGSAPGSIPYDFLQRSYRPPYDVGGGGGHGMMGPPQLQHALPYQPVDPITGGGGGGSQRPSNVPPLSFTGLSSGEYATSTDSDDSTPPTTGYYSPKYSATSVQRSFSGHQHSRPPSGLPSPHIGVGSGNGTRPSPLLKSNSEKLFDPRRVTQQSFNPTRNSLGNNNRSTHTSLTGNLSGRGKFFEEEEGSKAIYYSISPHHSFSIPPPPPAPIFPLKILSLDVNGSFNATDEAFTFARNGFFDYIEESKAQVTSLFCPFITHSDNSLLILSVSLLR
jgi:hypothetical protein